MKLTKSKLKRIIKEELAKEAWEGLSAAFKGPSLKNIEDRMITVSEDLEKLAEDWEEDPDLSSEAAAAFALLSALVNTYSNVLFAEERAGSYLPALEAAAKAWPGPIGDL